MSLYLIVLFKRFDVLEKSLVSLHHRVPRWQQDIVRAELNVCKLSGTVSPHSKSLLLTTAEGWQRINVSAKLKNAKIWYDG